MQLNHDSISTDFQPSHYSIQLQLGKSFLSQIPIYSSIRIGMSNLVLVNHHFIRLFTGMTFRDVYCSESDMITSIVFLKSIRRYVCLYNGNLVRIFSDSFHELSKFHSSILISIIERNEVLPELPSIVTCGPGNVTIWNFRSANTLIIPKVSHIHLFSPTHTPALLHLDSLVGKEQKCYIAIDEILIIFYLYDGSQVARVSNNWITKISSVMSVFHMNLYIIGCFNGSIILLDGNYELLHFLVGHSSAITCIYFISNCMILSASEDSTLRLWNIDTGEASQDISLQSPIHNILHCNDELLYLQAEFSIIELKLEPKHPLFYIAPFKIISLIYDSSNIFITMTDGIVFIFDVSTGCVSNFICIHSRYGSIEKVVPLLQFGRILILTSQGRIILCNARIFPISISHILTDFYTCICVYNLELKEGLRQNIEEEIIISSYNDNELQTFSSIIFFAGYSSGRIARINILTGKEEFSIQAHANKVFSIISQFSISKVLTFDSNGTVKVWHVYASIYECLSHIGTFTLISYPSVIIACKSRLCVAINHSDQALYLISMFNTRSFKKYTHPSDYDHKYLIRDLANHSLSGIFISVGMDKTIKLWDKNNILLSTVNVSCVPNCVCLTNDKADIVYSFNNMLIYAVTSSFVPDCKIQKFIEKKTDKPSFSPPSLLFGPLEKLESSCVDYLSSQCYENQTNVFSTPVNCFNEQGSTESLPFAHPVLLNKFKTDESQREEPHSVPIPVLKSFSSYQQRSWSEYFLSHLTLPYEMIINHDIFHVSNTSIQGCKKLNLEPNTLKEFRFFPLLAEDIDNNRYVPNSVLLLNYEELQPTSHRNSYEQWNSSKFDIGSTSQNNLSLPPQHEESQSFSNNNRHQDQNKCNGLTNESFFDTSASYDTTPKNQRIKQSNNLDDKQSKFVTNKKGFNMVKDFLISSMDINDRVPDNPGTFFLSTKIRSPTPSIDNVPNCIRPFLHTKWFKDLFSHPDSLQFPEEPSTCISIILSACSLDVHQDTISGALRAISQILNGIFLSASHKHHCAKILFNFLYFNSPQFVDKEFVFTYLEVLELFCNKYDVQYVSLLIFHFLLGNFDIRHHVLDLMEKFGLIDPLKNLSRELDSWDIHDITRSHHYSILVDQIIKWLYKISEDYFTLTKNTSISVNKVNFIDALNQFVKCSRQQISENVSSQQADSTRSTNLDGVSSLRSVISLPKIYSSCNSVRLGQIRSSRCHTERESSFMGDQKRILNNFSPYMFLQIPINRQNIKLPPLSEERNCSSVVNKRKKYFVISQSHSL